MNTEFKFKVSAVDDTKKTFSGVKNNFEELIKKYKQFSDVGKTFGKGKDISNIENQFRKLFDNMKNFNRKSDEFKKRQGRKTGDMSQEALETTGGIVASEKKDVYIAEKMKQYGDKMRLQKSKDRKEEENFVKKIAKDKSKFDISNADNFKKSLKSSEEITSKMRNNIKGINTELSRVSHKKVEAIIKPVETREDVSRKIDTRKEIQHLKNQLTSAKKDFEMSETPESKKAGLLMNLGQTLPYAGAVIAGVGLTYKMAEIASQQFQKVVYSQLGAIQTLGGVGIFRGAVRPEFNLTGQQKGYLGGTSYLTGTQKADMMAAIAKQTSGRTGRNIKGIDEDIVYSLGRVSTMYGISPEQIGGYAGTLERFKTKKDTGRYQMLSTLGLAERTGMGGARFNEFLDNFTNAVKEGVTLGMDYSNDDLRRSLASLTRTSDEKLKVLAPSIMSASMSTFSQAARMEGGPGEAFTFQSVYRGLKQKLGREPTMFETQAQLAQGSPIENLKMVVEEAERLYGKSDIRNMMLMRLPEFRNVGPTQMNDTIKMIKNYEALGKSESEKKLAEVGILKLQRREALEKPALDVTYMPEISREMADLTQVNRDSLEATVKIRDTLIKGFQMIDNIIHKGTTGKNKVTSGNIVRKQGG